MGYPAGLDEIPEAELYRELDRRWALRVAGCCDYCGVPFGMSLRDNALALKAAGAPGYENVDPSYASDGPCRFEERHNAEPPTTVVPPSKMDEQYRLLGEIAADMFRTIAANCDAADHDRYYGLLARLDPGLPI